MNHKEPAEDAREQIEAASASVAANVQPNASAREIVSNVLCQIDERRLPSDAAQAIVSALGFGGMDWATLKADATRERDCAEQHKADVCEACGECLRCAWHPATCDAVN